MTEHNETTLADYLAVLRRRRLLVAVVALVCAAAAFVASALQTPEYQATSSLTVRDVSQDPTLSGNGFGAGQTQLQIASVHAPQVTRNSVVDAVRADVGGSPDLNTLRDRVDIEIDPNSFLVKITAHARHADDAAALANAFAREDAALSTRETRDQYAASARKVESRLKKLRKPTRNGTIDRDATQRATLQAQLARLQSLSTVSVPVEVSDRARIPGSPASPKPIRNAIAALIFGVLLGIAIAYARAALDHRLRSSAEVERALDRAVVGHIRSQALGHTGTDADEHRKGLGPLTEPDEESFRILRHNVRYLAAGEGLRTIVVTSAMAQEGKSTVSACLAMASAAAGSRTLLIECDLRRPVMADRFALAETPGLSDYLTGHAQPHEILQTVEAAPSQETGADDAVPLVCITAGSVPPRPADLLASERFRNFLTEVEAVYDTIIIDSAPLLAVADTLEIIPSVSGIILCVRLHQTTRDQAGAARAALARLPDRPTGIALTDIKDTGEGYYGYYGAPPQVEANV